MKIILPLFTLLVSMQVCAQGVTVANNPMQVDVDQYLKDIQLPDGFEISVYARGLPNARSLTKSDNGTIYVGSRGSSNGRAVGNVYALINNNADGKADEVLTIASGLNTPNGVAWHKGDLYIAEINQISKIAKVDSQLPSPPAPKVINSSYPTDGHHGWKFIRFGPDDKLYVPVGAPCNTCEKDAPYASITRIDADGNNKEIFAKGIRNTVGFDWNPETGEMWFTDNGRDMLGDDIPPEEINRVSAAGQHFGFPYKYGKNSVTDDSYKIPGNIDFIPAAVEMPAHSAGLGMRFYTGDSFPAEYKNDIFVAYHGSWNRSQPQGYEIVRVNMENGEAIGHEVFASGWLQNEKYWGRPVDIEVMTDGSLLISDDFNGVVYRIAYTK